MTSDLVERWKLLTKMLAKNQVKLLAVSKYTDDISITIIADAGQKVFAESRPQLLRDRAQKFPDLQWHMIGAVQKNKAKYVGRFADMWHSVIDIDTAKVVDSYVTNGRVLPVLIQVDVSGEAQKQGVLSEDVLHLYQQIKVNCPKLLVIGLMGMAAKQDEDIVRHSFRKLRMLRDQLLQDVSVDTSFCELSMGMSNDFHIAIEEGATMVRIGSVLFNDKDGK